jgi:hypothetical protein
MQTKRFGSKFVLICVGVSALVLLLAAAYVAGTGLAAWVAPNLVPTDPRAIEREQWRKIADDLGRVPNGTIEESVYGDILNPYGYRLKFATTIDSVEAFKKQFEAISECTPKLVAEGESTSNDFVNQLLVDEGRNDLIPNDPRSKVKRVEEAVMDTGQNYVGYTCRFPAPEGAQYVLTYIAVSIGDPLYEYDGVPIKPGFISIHGPLSLPPKTR